MDAMLGPMLKLAAVKVREEVSKRGMEAVAADYAVTVRRLMAELSPQDRELVERILAQLQVPAHV